MSFQPLLKQSEFIGITPSKQESTLTSKGLKICKYLENLPFCCGDDTLHLQNPDYKETARCCHTHIIGLPKHPATGEEMFLTPYQLDFAEKVIHGRKKFGNDSNNQTRKSLKMHIKKGRQMGFTEIVLRLILYFCFNRYAGYNIGIIAATNGSLAKKDLRRLARLLRYSIPGVVSQWVKGATLRLVNGCVVEAFSASEEALTGDTNYKCIFMDEAAKWKLQDDEPVFNSILPIIRTNGADLYLVSTPKGPIKKFYEIDDRKEHDFDFYEYNIWRTEGNLYTKKEIEEMIATSTEDPKQEYLCEYTIGRGSVFETVTEDSMHGKTEWYEEDDGYEEDRSYDSDIHEEEEWS